MATIIDVANAANVSISTVSRVINGKNNVSFDKKERVLDAIRETGYVPPVHSETILAGREDKEDSAPEPETQATEDGGILLVVSNVIHKELFSSLRENAQDYGYEALFLVAEAQQSFSALTQKALQQLQQSGLIRGVALINPLYDHKELYNLPVFQKLPTIQIDGRYEGSSMSFVGNNDYQAVVDMTSYLLERYDNVAYLSVFTQNNPEKVVLSFAADRERGFRDTMREHGFSENELCVLHPEHTFSGGRQAARELLAKGSLPAAILCGSDYIALGLIHEMEKNGVHVPMDLGVACISGENEYPDILHPRLTRVQQSFDDIGHAAIQVLHDVITNRFSAQRSILINYQLVPGETTKQNQLRI